MIKILLHGYNGAMGKTILETLPRNMEVVVGVAHTIDVQSFPTYDDIFAVKEDFDIIVDFSHVSALENVLNFALERNKPLLIASTGITEEINQKIDEVSKSIPLVQAGNYSIGIYAMNKVAKELALILDDFDLEIVEKHHKFKKDAPSGTAEMLFDSLQEARKNLKPVYGREGQSDTKDISEVGMHSLRQGTVIGEHSVYFAGLDELIEIKHTALSKKVFAKGTFKAVNYLLNKTNGRYTLEDVIENV